MIKILTATEADVIAQALREAIEVLMGEGYPDEADECVNALKILNELQSKRVEDVIT